MRNMLKTMKTHLRRGEALVLVTVIAFAVIALVIH